MIRIEWLNDEHDCDTCGYNYTTGARVFLNGDLLLELEPAVSCYDSQHYDEADVYRSILERLGHQIEEMW